MEVDDMSKNLFRKESLDRISSPEQLNDYLRVAAPSVWLLLTAVVALLIGLCVWGVFGHLDTTLTVTAVAQENSVVAYVRAEDMLSVREGAAVSLGESTGTVSAISDQPIEVDEAFTDYMRHVGGLREGEWVYAVKLDADCADGVHAARIVVDSVSPLSFVLN